MQVEVRTVKKGQIVEFAMSNPNMVRRAKVIKTRKNAVTVLLENINDIGWTIMPADSLVTIVNI
jgi:hypothetical protein